VGGGGVAAAERGVDYDAAGGTVTYAPGQPEATATITIHGDLAIEPDDLVVVAFHSPSGARLGGFYGLGFGVITDDDA
jgi:hypothetical protein